MEDVFETVEPSQSNLTAYGHKIREILLLAAMEVEASWAAVLKVNNHPGSRFSTNDYVKLLQPMLLDSFKLTLRSYPKFPAIIPFKGWNPQSPTKSLDWYDAYNQTKHDREAHLSTAGMYGDLQGIADKSLDEIAGLEIAMLPAGEDETSA